MLLNQLQTVLTAPPLVNQNGMVIWLMGLSGAGKSTIAGLLKEQLTDNGIFAVILDGDEMRQTISKDLSFTPAHRLENVRRVAEIARMLAQNNVVSICSLITPLHEHQQAARQTVKENYFEVFVDCPVSACENRDVKGLYKLARQEKIKDFTGISAPFQRPLAPHLILRSATELPYQSAEKLYSQVIYSIIKTEL